MITKIVYIHNDLPYDVYKKNISEPEILPNIIQSISFFQDLGIPSIEGEIVISDFVMYDLLPLHIEDKIRIYTINPIYSADETITIGKDYYTEFRILLAEPISSEPNVVDKDNFKQFILRIIDNNSFEGYLQKQSKMYQDKTISEIVYDSILPLWKPKTSNIKINPNISKDKFNITFPKWSVYEKLNYLSKFTEFSDGTGCVYFNSLPLFYENGSSEYDFNYTNLSALFKNEESFIDEEYSLTGNINRIYNVFVDKDNNYFETIDRGLVINDVKVSDIRRNKLNKFFPYDDIKKEYNIIKPKSFWNLNYENNYIMKNIMDNIVVYFTVAGDYKRKIGTTINLKFPSQFDSNNKKDFYDKRMSGKYLIKSIEHIFVKDDNQTWLYNQKIGSVTDGYNEKE